MNTIMNRWKEVKTGLENETVRVINCLNEARSIIKKECGQDMSATGSFPVFYSSYSATYLQAPGYVYYMKPDVIIGHYPGKLIEAENFLEFLKAVNTGTFISYWEASQAD